MEKPWMDSLMDALQGSPTKTPPPEEPVSEEPAYDSAVSERPSVSAPFADNFAGGIDSRWTRPTRPPLDYEGTTYWNESWSDRLLARAPAITVVLLFVVALAALSFFYMVQVGHSLVRLGERISGESAQNTVTSAASTNASIAQPPAPQVQSGPPQPASSPNPSPAIADGATASPPVESPKHPRASRNRASNDRASSDSRGILRRPPTENSNPGISEGADDGGAEFRLAHLSLGQARTPEAKAKAAGLLWAAVTKGSSDAEIELADVYGRGNGVRKNCQQARILLAAARDKHNPLAEKESAELRVYGCR